MGTDGEFDEAYERLAAIGYRVAFRILGDRGDAEDVAQEALARAMVRWSSVAGHAEPWVGRVATNLALTRWRRRRPSEQFSERHDRAHRSDPAPLDRLVLVTALVRLPRRQREAVALRYLADLSERDVAAALNTTVGAVKQHTHRGIARLRADQALHLDLGAL